MWLHGRGEIKLQQNNIWLACKFDESKTTPLSLVTGVFNFDNKQGRIKQDLFNKDYLKQYAEKTSRINIMELIFIKTDLLLLKNLIPELKVPLQEHLLLITDL